MHQLRLDTSGPDALVLAKLLVFLNTVFAMAIAKLLPPQLGQEETMKYYGFYQQHYEGGKFGDRNEIWRRNQARKEICERAEKILRFLESVADENDLIQLQNGGVEQRKSSRKKAAKSKQTPVAD